MRRSVASVLVASVLVGLCVSVGLWAWASVGAADGAADVTEIPADFDVDYQLGGTNDDLPADVGIVVRDRTESPRDGAFNVCYVNGFQAQPDARKFWRHHWRLVLKKNGKPVTDTAWHEWLLDTRTPARRTALGRILGGWIDGCAEEGFDAVEFDNLDSFTRSRKMISRRQGLAFAAILINRAHKADLLAGQKNLAGYDGTRIGFDFAVSEECGAWDECRAYADDFGDQVLAVEYRKKDYRTTCAEFGDRWPVVLRDRNLTPTGIHRYC
ncbi:MAG: endo alpha-1,4 polygalactosaminidase [Nocardioides sp.]